MLYTYDVPMDVFQPLNGRTALSYALITEHTTEGGVHLPPELQKPLTLGDEVNYNVCVPPGVSVAGWYLQLNNRSLTLGVDEEPIRSDEPTIFPLRHRIGVDPAITGCNLVASMHKLRLKWTKEELLMGFSVTWQIRPEYAYLYEAWLAAGKPIGQPAVTEDRAYSLVRASGLIDPMMAISNSQNLEELAAKANTTGVWKALVKLIELSGKP